MELFGENNQSEFEKWCKGETGYPMVDAGMRELNSTGFMPQSCSYDYRKFFMQTFAH